MPRTPTSLFANGLTAWTKCAEGQLRDVGLRDSAPCSRNEYTRAIEIIKLVYCKALNSFTTFGDVRYFGKAMDGVSNFPCPFLYPQTSDLKSILRILCNEFLIFFFVNILQFCTELFEILDSEFLEVVNGEVIFSFLRTAFHSDLSKLLERGPNRLLPVFFRFPILNVP